MEFSSLEDLKIETITRERLNGCQSVCQYSVKLTNAPRSHGKQQSHPQSHRSSLTSVAWSTKLLIRADVYVSIISWSDSCLEQLSRGKDFVSFFSAQRASLLLLCLLTHTANAPSEKFVFSFLLQEISHFRTNTQNNFLIESRAWISRSFGSESSGRRSWRMKNILGNAGKAVVKLRHKLFSSLDDTLCVKNLCVEIISGEFVSEPTQISIIQ